MADNDGPNLDIDRIVSTLAAHGVNYVLIGGVANRLRGAERATQDLDLVATRDLDNLERVAAALRELGAFLRIHGVDDETARAFPIQLDGRWLAAIETSTWRTDAGDLDVLSFLEDSNGTPVPYAELSRRSGEATIGGVIVRVAALDDIIAAKTRAGRPKDNAALPELLALRDQERDDTD